MAYATVEAATVICLRHRGTCPGAVLQLGDLALPSNWWARLPETIPFEAGWEVVRADPKRGV